MIKLTNLMKYRIIVYKHDISSEALITSITVETEIASGCAWLLAMEKLVVVGRFEGVLSL